MALWLYLHFEALQLDSLHLPQNADAAVAVVDEQQHQVVQLNAAAASLGIKMGMGLAMAGALSHQLQIIAYQPPVQQQILQSVAQQLYRLTADIALDPPQGLYIRITDMLVLYGGLKQYWQQLSRHLHVLGYRYCYATGYSAYAAKCLALQQLNLLSDDKAVLFTALANSDLRFAQLPAQQQQQLARLGIRQLKQLFSLSPAELARRFEPGLCSYLGRLKGEFYHALPFYQPAERFSRYLELLYDINNIAVLEGPLQQLLQQLENVLQLSNSVTQQIQLQLYLRDNNTGQDKDSLKLTISSAQAEYRAARWLQLAQLQLESVTLPGPVYALQLQVTQFLSQQSKSEGLFDDNNATLSALQLVSMLQAKLGVNRVQGLALSNQHLPEHSVLSAWPVQQTELVEPMALRPAWLITQPCPLTEEVELNYGPERIASNWWPQQPVGARQESVQQGRHQQDITLQDNTQPDTTQRHGAQAERDYFIARNSKGQWLWLFRTPANSWFVQGVFS